MHGLQSFKRDFVSCLKTHPSSVIASEAKQSMARRARQLDCLVAALAMTVVMMATPDR
jgi:hypothetical protein